MIASVDGFGGPFSFVIALVLAFILVAAWVILAASRFVQGGIVERPERVPQLYGYTACLAGLLWAMSSAVTYDRARRFGSPSDEKSAPVGSIPETELRRRYEALRADRIEQARFKNRNAIVSSLVTLLLGSALFLFHWRWLRRRRLDLDGVRSEGSRAPLVS